MQGIVHKRTVYSGSRVLGQRKQMASEPPAFKSARIFTDYSKPVGPPRERGGESLAVESKDRCGDKKHCCMWDMLKQVHADCSASAAVVTVMSTSGQNQS